MNTITDINYTRPPIDSEILEMMLERLYNIVPMSKAIAHENCSAELRQDCLDKIDEFTVSLGTALTMIEEDVRRMDKQIIGLIAHAKQRTTQSLN